MNLKLKSILTTLSLSCLLTGCGGGHAHFHEGKEVFKGKIAKVEYMLTRGVTILTDEEGKTTSLKGFPGIPTGEVEIFLLGDHEYEVFQAPISL